MAEFPALNLWTDAWKADTDHLARAVRGLYMDMIILCWRSPGCRVPNELPWLIERLQCSEDEIPALEKIIHDFWTSDGNWLQQKRLTQEFRKARKRSEVATVSANRRWKKDKGPSGGNAARSNPTTTITTNTYTPGAPPSKGGSPNFSKLNWEEGNERPRPRRRTETRFEATVKEFLHYRRRAEERAEAEEEARRRDGDADRE